MTSVMRKVRSDKLVKSNYAALHQIVKLYRGTIGPVGDLTIGVRIMYKHKH